jgi:hypothetical protein
VLVLAVSGVLEGFVTPSPLPTWARIMVGLTTWAGFIGYLRHFGRRAAQAGLIGDVDRTLAGDAAPVAG